MKWILVVIILLLAVAFGAVMNASGLYEVIAQRRREKKMRPRGKGERNE